MLRPSTLLAMAAFASACGASPDQPVPARPSVVETGLSAMFREAAAEFAVPQPLLEAIGWTETHWRMRPGVPSLDGGYGLMHVVDAGHDGPLARAARLTGLSEEDVRTDSRSNVRAAAALLRESADRYFSQNPAKREARLEDWWQVVMRYAGYDDPVAADAFATSVYATVRRGARVVLDDGTLQVLSPQPVEVEGEKLFGRMQSALTPDYALAEAHPAASTNYTSGRGASLSRIVIHTAQGPYTSVYNWFANPAAKASAHYVVGSGGDVAQMVADEDTAWHAGNWSYNQSSIGIEHEGYVDDASWLTDELYTASANLSKWLCDTHGIPKDRAHVIGHNEVPNPSGDGRMGGKGGHTDPCVTVDGAVCHWDWDRYMALLGGRAVPPPVDDPPPVTKKWRLAGNVFDHEGCPVPKVTSPACRPVAGAVVTVTSPGAPWSVPVVVDERGAFAFEMNEGEYVVTASAPGFSAGSAATAARHVPASPGAATTFGSLLLDRQGGEASLAGLVRATSGTALSGAEVAFGARTTLTDAAGRFSLTSLPEGLLNVRFSRTGYGTTTLRALAATAPAGLVVELAPAGKSDGGSGLDDAPVNGGPTDDAAGAGSDAATGRGCSSVPADGLVLALLGLFSRRFARLRRLAAPATLP
jgi:N-acetyl-anhydromuramyl-L-alanine amidase AmpD